MLNKNYINKIGIIAMNPTPPQGTPPPGRPENRGTSYPNTPGNRSGGRFAPVTEGTPHADPSQNRVAGYVNEPGNRDGGRFAPVTEDNAPLNPQDNPWVEKGKELTEKTLRASKKASNYLVKKGATLLNKFQNDIWPQCKTKGRIYQNELIAIVQGQVDRAQAGSPTPLAAPLTATDPLFEQMVDATCAACKKHFTQRQQAHPGSYQNLDHILNQFKDRALQGKLPELVTQFQDDVQEFQELTKNAQRIHQGFHNIPEGKYRGMDLIASQAFQNFPVSNEKLKQDQEELEVLTSACRALLHIYDNPPNNPPA